MADDTQWGSVTNDEKVVQNRLRRVAERQGLTLRKNRQRDTRAVKYGLWFLENAEGKCLVESRDLKDIAAALREVV